MAFAGKDLSAKFAAASITDEKSFDYFPLKMLIDKKTEMYVKFAKVMVIFQGPYTSERSRVLDVVEKKFKYASRMISDDTYKKERVTTCSHERTEEFYDYFKKESRRALEEGNNLLVIDSTMSNILQNQYYIALAHIMQYVVLVVPPIVTGTDKGNDWPSKSQAASFREVKQYIPSATQFQPLFCAWYLHDIDSNELRHEAGLYIQDCIEDIPRFKDMLSKLDFDKSKADDEAYFEINSNCSFVDKIINYFNLVDKRQDLAYCVTKIFDNKLFSMNAYFKKEAVKSNYGKMSKLIIAGFIVSPHMVAARVKLSHHQKELWERDDEIDENTKVTLICPSDLFQQSKNELPEVEVNLISSKSNQTMINSGHTVHDPTENIPRFAKGRGCHIVLGKSSDAPSRHVDFDVQFALRRENKAAKAELEVYDLERCVVKRIGKYWLINLKEMISVEGFFASCVKPFPYENAIK